MKYLTPTGEKIMKFRGLLALVLSLSLALFASNALAAADKKDGGKKNDKQSSQQIGKSDKSSKNDNSSKSDKSDNSTKSDKSDKSSKSDKSDKSSKSDKSAKSDKSDKSSKSSKPGNGYGHCKSDKSGIGHSKKIGNGHNRDDDCDNGGGGGGTSPTCAAANVVRFDRVVEGSTVSVDWVGHICVNDPSLLEIYRQDIVLTAENKTCRAGVAPVLERVVSTDGLTFSYPVNIVLPCTDNPPPPPSCTVVTPVRYTRLDAAGNTYSIDWVGQFCEANAALLAPYLVPIETAGLVCYSLSTPSLVRVDDLATNTYAYPVNVVLRCFLPE